MIHDGDVDPRDRSRMSGIAKKTKRYLSDVTDAEMERVAPLMPSSGWRGHLREREFREAIKAVRYLVQFG